MMENGSDALLGSFLVGEPLRECGWGRGVIADKRGSGHPSNMPQLGWVRCWRQRLDAGKELGPVKSNTGQAPCQLWEGEAGQAASLRPELWAKPPGL